MSRPKFYNSVVFRLALAVVLGGLLGSIGLSVLELRSSEMMLQMEVTQRVVMAVRNLQSVVRSDTFAESTTAREELLNLIAADTPITAIHLRIPDETTVSTGHWPIEPPRVESTWILPEHGLAMGNEVFLDKPTYVSAPFQAHGKRVDLQIILDGPRANAQLRRRVSEQTAAQWMLLSIVVLFVLLLLRRWVLGPLSELMHEIQNESSSEAFGEIAAHKADEFGQLAGAIGAMLSRLDTTTEQLRHREAAFANLYQFAPAAMLSLNSEGVIYEANRRAADALGFASDADLIGCAALDLVRAEDRPILRQAIDRLAVKDASRCELQLTHGERNIDTMVDVTAVRDHEGVLHTVRIAFLDVTDAKQLQRKIADQTELLNLIINHMSDGILLVDAEGQIAAYNDQLSTLLKVRTGAMIGRAYDAAVFWDELGIVNHHHFVSRMEQIEAESVRSAQERFETSVGTFLFQGIPVHDAQKREVGRLWVVQEITSQEQNERLLAQKTDQLRALKVLTNRLAAVSSVDDMLARAGSDLLPLFGVDAIGLAVRREGRDGNRSQQVLNRGDGAYAVGPNRQIIEAVERHLMPTLISSHDVTYWSEVPADLPWSPAFTQAGLTSLAGASLRVGAESHGILWIAHRFGRHLEESHLYLLQTLAPMIAARLETVKLRERMTRLEMTDPVTLLPNTNQLDREVQRLAKRPGHPWAVVAVDVDHFTHLSTVLPFEEANATLREVASAITSTVRTAVFVARLPGARFAIVSADCDVAAADHIANRVLEAIRKLAVVLPDRSTHHLTASIGVAIAPRDLTTPAAMLESAIARAEIAKRAGRDRRVLTGVAPDQRAG